MTLLEKFARTSVSAWPTPIEPLARLSAELDGPQIFVKREDFGSLAFGGNKLRKLEYLLGDAQRQGCDVILTAGALQSNHARLTAAVAARLGLECHLVLKDEVRGRSAAYAHSANRFLDDLLGAKVETIGPDASVPDTLAALAETMRQAGRKPYAIPIGGSNAVGNLGYVDCALEIATQEAALGQPFTHIFVTSGSGGTHAGLLVGCSMANISAKVIGVSIARDLAKHLPIVSDLVQQTADLIGVAAQDALNAIHLDGEFYLPGYGLPNPSSIEAINLCARLEGVLLDPVYTSKTMAALIAGIRSGKLGKQDRVLFLHTGGSPALFVYEEAFNSAA